MIYTRNGIKKFAVIVAGGNGRRMKLSTPKQFLEINGLPILMHTINAFITFVPAVELIIVLPEKEADHWEELCNKFNYNIKHKIAFSGGTRFHSVKNGLAQISGEGIVFIHDGVRPLVSKDTIDNCYQTAVQKGNALPVIKPSESLRKASGDHNRAVDRNSYYLVQTPQTFRVSLIKKAYNQNYNTKFTDDASVLESTGKNIYLVEGNRENIKITYAEDIYLAETYMSYTK
jgi:2-C-methyl-D-erythritol 4-phosphate cytidylyltransferase